MEPLAESDSDAHEGKPGQAQKRNLLGPDKDESENLAGNDRCKDDQDHGGQKGDRETLDDLIDPQKKLLYAASFIEHGGSPLG
jgi:hypothetical protein